MFTSLSAHDYRSSLSILVFLMGVVTRSHRVMEGSSKGLVRMEFQEVVHQLGSHTQPLPQTCPCRREDAMPGTRVGSLEGGDGLLLPHPSPSPFIYWTQDRFPHLSLLKYPMLLQIINFMCPQSVHTRGELFPLIPNSPLSTGSLWIRDKALLARLVKSRVLAWGQPCPLGSRDELGTVPVLQEVTVYSGRQTGKEDRSV